MSNELIKYAFVSGEVSKTLLGRTDLEKYDFGLEIARNFFVDYQGGLSNRPGTEFCDFIADAGNETKFFRFSLSPDVANTYGVLFGNGYIRFVQDGGYVLETAKTVLGVVRGATTTLNVTGHGYSNGDVVRASGFTTTRELNNRSFIVANATANSFEINLMVNVALDSSGYEAYLGGGSVSRAYTLVSPYAAADLPRLKMHQLKDRLRFTHKNYPIYELSRTNHTSWTMGQLTIGSGHASPNQPLGQPNPAGAAGMVWGVTAVSLTGEESVISPLLMETASVAYNTTAGSYRLSWDPVAGTAYYNIYRSAIYPDGADVSAAAQLGYVGRTAGCQFVDNNIIPNFAITPPEYKDPFGNGSIVHVDVTATGTGYSNLSAVSVVDPTGTGFLAYPIVDKGSGVTAIKIVSAGKNYTNPVFSISGGSGAVLVPRITSLTGNSPGTGTVCQQRDVYAGSTNEPLTLWGSRVGKYNNFDVSVVVVANDAYEHTIDSEELSGIRHLFPTRGGMLVMSQVGVWQVSGGEEGAITPTNALAEPHSYTGVSELPPIRIESDLLYVEGKGYTVRMLSYNEISRVYGGTDVSILSNHLFAEDKQLSSWAYAKAPFSLTWAVRTDGALLTFTSVKEQNVYAWTQNWTQGFYRDVITIQENVQDSVYQVVERQLEGYTQKTIERVASRKFSLVEDAFFVDCGLRNTPTYPAGSVISTAIEGEGVVVNATTSIFTAGDVGKILRMGGGKAEVIGYVSGTQITVDWHRAMTDGIPETSPLEPRLFTEGEWTLDTPFTEISGLWHLEGKTVSILADGNVVPRRVVENGVITLENAATRVVVGLPYRSLARTLPPTAMNAIIEGHRKRPVGVAVRTTSSRGLKVGRTLDTLKPMKERKTQAYGESIPLQDQVKYVLLTADWDEDGQIYYVQDDPLPVTLLGYVLDLEIGDDND